MRKTIVPGLVLLLALCAAKILSLQSQLKAVVEKAQTSRESNEVMQKGQIEKVSILEHQVESHKRDAATLRDEITTLGKEALALGKEAAVTLRKKIEHIGNSLQEFHQQANRIKRQLLVDADGLIRQVPHQSGVGEPEHFLGSYPVSKVPLPPELRDMVSDQLHAQQWMDQTLTAIESALKLTEKTEGKAEKINQLDTKTPEIDF